MSAPHHEDDRVTLFHGDCLDVLASLPDASVDSVVTDPPYGLGFMGKAWDDLPPGVEWARECLRVLKPGGHLLAFGGTRTWHRLAVVVEDAGFEIRDSLAWMHGQGFPKGKASLKPAFEPVVVGRKKPKPREGLLQIDACRIETSPEDARAMERANTPGSGQFKAARSTPGAMGRSRPSAPLNTTIGRWPANVVLDESQAEALDQQSGNLPSQKTRSDPAKGSAVTASHLGGLNATRAKKYPGETGGASRFFYVAKASKRERPVVDGVAHPTVKPLALMRWLVRLVTPPGGTVLEPFAGSGTTVEAALLEGFRCIAVEREAEYLPLTLARIERHADELDISA